MRVPADLRAKDSDLGRLMLRAPDGHVFPLKRVANIVAISGQPQIQRENLKRMVAVTARISGRSMGSVMTDVQKMLTDAHLPAGMMVELGGLYAQQQVAFRGLVAVFVAALGLVFMLLMLMYERFSVVLSIMAMPLLAIPAVFAGLWVTGMELNISSMMGMTMIIGIVTEAAIFYFSELQEEQAGGPGSHAVLVACGSNRMRPIVMTGLAAILTLLPLALAIGQGSGMQQPLAVAVISGLVVQPFLVLIVMPVLYSILAGKHNFS